MGMVDRTVPLPCQILLNLQKCGMYSTDRCDFAKTRIMHFDECGMNSVVNRTLTRTWDSLASLANPGPGKRK